MATDMSFPEGFVWGVATASYQIEGAVNEGGRGASIWDTFSHTPGRTINGDTGDVTCRHYHNVDKDVELMRRLGVGAYRFSIAWPRVQPDGKGSANQAGLDFYRRLVAALRDQGITPMATLYHWDLPQVLEDEGGWTVRGTAERYADYVSLVAEALGDEVGMWITLNEPWCSSWLGYAVGAHAPGRRDPAAGLAATHHLLLGHARGTEALRKASRAPVGITLNVSSFIPASSHELDVAAAKLADSGLNGMFLGPIFKGQYPDEVFDLFLKGDARANLVRDGDLDAISKPVDFLGANYYFSSV
ncbi:MAG TPA: family 1 glycosylhydrolase, partial [Acidimicrobiales bacterium]|nr:family 1 glycosylhydrolase [Acidimicrobiales bacterium]